MATGSPTTPVMLSRGAATGPLDARELDRAHATASRLAQELLALIARVPRSGASSVSLARDLRLDRMLCHRVCSALESDWQELLLRLPGPDSLRKFLAAAAKKAGDAALRTGGDAAVDQFQRLIWEVGGSQTRLNARIKSTRDRQSIAAELGLDAAPGSDEARAMIFEGARKTMGAWSDALIQIGVIHPTADPRVFSQQLLIGCRGLRTSGSPFPLVPTVRMTRYGQTKDDLVDIDPPQPNQDDYISSLGILREFSTFPFPPIRQQSLGNREMLVLDIGDAAGQGIDLMFSKQAASLNLDDVDTKFPMLVHQGRTPSRHLTLDLFVHRSVPMTGAAGVSAVYPWFLSKNTAESAWQDALPGELRLEMLGSGLDGAHNPRWHRHRELCAHLIQRSGFDASEFIGYRCTTAFPYWGASYVISVQLNPR